MDRNLRPRFSWSDFLFLGESTYPSSSFISFPSILKSLVLCPTTPEKNLLADAAWIMIKGNGLKINGQKKLLVDELIKVGYDFSICLSQWEKTSSLPPVDDNYRNTKSFLDDAWNRFVSLKFTTTEYGTVWSNSEAPVGSLQFGMVVIGKYEYIDVIFEGEDRVLIDVDFRSQFKIARSTKKYHSLLQMLPSIFVGRPDHIRQIVAVMYEVAKQSLKKKGLHIPPWRKLEYTRSKWVAPH